MPSRLAIKVLALRSSRSSWIISTVTSCKSRESWLKEDEAIESGASEELTVTDGSDGSDTGGSDTVCSTGGSDTVCSDGSGTGSSEELTSVTVGSGSTFDSVTVGSVTVGSGSMFDSVTGGSGSTFDSVTVVSGTGGSGSTFGSGTGGSGTFFSTSSMESDRDRLDAR